MPLCNFSPPDTAKTTRIPDYYSDSVYDHLGGGLFGGILVRIIGLAFGEIGAYVIVIIGIIISAIIMTQKPFFTFLHEGGSRVWKTAKEQRQQSVQQKKEAQRKRAARVSEEEESPEEDASVTGKEPAKKKRFFVDFNLKEEEHTHQMAMPELSIHRAQETEAADASAAEPEEVPESSGRKRHSNPKSSPSEIAENVTGIRQEISEHPAPPKTAYRFPPLSLLKKRRPQGFRRLGRSSERDGPQAGTDAPQFRSERFGHQCQLRSDCDPV